MTLGSIGSSDPLAFSSGSFSITSWFFPTEQTSGFPRIISKSTGVSGAGGYDIFLSDAGTTWYCYVGGNSTLQVIDDIVLNEWNHITITYDGTTYRAYTGGSLSMSQIYSSPPTTTATLDIGRSAGLGARNFAGNIDQPIFWDKALSVEEIRESMQLRDMTQHSASGNIIEEYGFNDGNISGTTVTPTVGSIDGTLVNGATNAPCVPYPRPYQLLTDNITPYSANDSGWGWDFDGSNDYIDLIDSDVVPPEYQNIGNNSDYSITAWIKTTASSLSGVYWFASDTIFELRQESGSGTKVPLSFGISSNKISIGRSNDYISGSEAIIGTSEVNDGRWHLITATISGDDVIIYIDENQDKSDSFSVATGDCSVSTSISNMQIGIRSRDTGDKTTDSFSGSLGDVIIWDKKLSPSDVVNIRNNHEIRNETTQGLSGNIISYWRGVDSSTGSDNVVDQSGNGNHGTMTNMTDRDVILSNPRPYFDTANVGSFAMDGSNDYVSVPDAADLSFTDGATDLPFTISFSIYGNGNNAIDSDIVINKLGEWQIMGNSSNRIYIDLQTDASNYLRVITVAPGTVDLREWKDFTITYDGSETAAGIKILANGVDISSTKSEVGTYTGMVAGSNIVKIGGTAEVNFSNVSIWDKELDACEGDELYNDGTPPDLSEHPAYANCIRWYRMDATDDPTGTVTDQTGNSDATATNMVAGDLELDIYPLN